MWETLKQILPTNAKQTKFCDPPTKLCDFSFLENPMDIAESFNTYFVNPPNPMSSFFEQIYSHLYFLPLRQY